MQLRRWDTSEVIFELECNSLKDLVEGAIKANISLYRVDLSNSDLCNANLSNYDLSNSNLSNSYLCGADFSNSNISNSDFNNSNLSNSYFSNANLSNSNLRNAILINAILSNANLSNANILALGNMKELRTMQLDKYTIGFTKDTLQISCKRHSLDEWKSFDDKAIARMDDGALEWWNKWKEFIFQAIELSFSKEV
jgi:uncharacterized protein YjbI with pentapeptide repeats